MNLGFSINKDLLNFVFNGIRKNWKSLLLLSIGILLGYLPGHFGWDLSLLKSYVQKHICTYKSHQYQAGESLYATYPHTRLRMEPYTSNKTILHRLEIGEEVIYTGKSSKHSVSSTVNGELIREYFLEVRSPKYGITGYIFAGTLSNQKPKYIKSHLSQTEEEAANTDLFVTKGEGINLRQSPEIHASNIIKSIRKGDILTLLNTSEKEDFIATCGNKELRPWYYVALYKDPTIQGWIYGGCLKYLKEHKYISDASEEFIE